MSGTALPSQQPRETLWLPASPLFWPGSGKTGKRSMAKRGGMVKRTDAQKEDGAQMHLETFPLPVLSLLHRLAAIWAEEKVIFKAK